METKSIYQSPEQSARDTSEMSDLELRNYYSQDEICVQAVAWIYLFSGSFVAVLTLVFLKLSTDIDHLLLQFMSFCTLIVSVVFVLLGWGMRNYEPWSRTPARFAAIVMMFFVPLGTLVGIICFFLLKERAHREIFTVKYHAILLSDPLQNKYHKFWVPILIGATTASLITLAVIFQRHLIIELLTSGHSF
ncbi:MAG: hypothetical protein ABGY95_11965 [Rubritalea sp.]|uniref:hypothetical protein n=1 Tax=Rubritalea sp. TaxID=2109375 RepID=UPI003242A9E7